MRAYSTEVMLAVIQCTCVGLWREDLEKTWTG